MALTRRNFSLAAEKAALIHSLRSAEKNWFAMCSDFREAGLHWLNIRAECKERKINAGKWAAENAQSDCGGSIDMASLPADGTNFLNRGNGQRRSRTLQRDALAYGAHLI